MLMARKLIAETEMGANQSKSDSSLPLRLPSLTVSSPTRSQPSSLVKSSTLSMLDDTVSLPSSRIVDSVMAELDTSISTKYRDEPETQKQSVLSPKGTSAPAVELPSSKRSQRHFTELPDDVNLDSDDLLSLLADDESVSNEIASLLKLEQEQKKLHQEQAQLAQLSLEEETKLIEASNLLLEESSLIEASLLGSFGVQNPNSSSAAQTLEESQEMLSKLLSFEEDLLAEELQREFFSPASFDDLSGLSLDSLSTGQESQIQPTTSKLQETPPSPTDDADSDALMNLLASDSTSVIDEILLSISTPRPSEKPLTPGKLISHEESPVGVQSGIVDLPPTLSKPEEPLTVEEDRTVVQELTSAEFLPKSEPEPEPIELDIELEEVTLEDLLASSNQPESAVQNDTLSKPTPEPEPTTLDPEPTVLAAELQNPTQTEIPTEHQLGSNVCHETDSDRTSLPIEIQIQSSLEENQTNGSSGSDSVEEQPMKVISESQMQLPEVENLLDVEIPVVQAQAEELRPRSSSTVTLSDSSTIRGQLYAQKHLLETKRAELVLKRERFNSKTRSNTVVAPVVDLSIQPVEPQYLLEKFKALEQRRKQIQQEREQQALQRQLVFDRNRKEAELIEKSKRELLDLIQQKKQLAQLELKTSDSTASAPSFVEPANVRVQSPSQEESSPDPNAGHLEESQNQPSSEPVVAAPSSPARARRNRSQLNKSITALDSLLAEMGSSSPQLKSKGPSGLSISSDHASSVPNEIQTPPDASLAAVVTPVEPEPEPEFKLELPVASLEECKNETPIDAEPEDDPRVKEILYTDGAKYIGQVDENNKWNGRGRVLFSDGNVYEGEVENDFMQGIGSLCYANGDKYVGQWFQDLRHGWGQYASLNGDVYEGNYLHGERSGKGVYLMSCGDKYEGNFLRGLPNGQGG